MKTTLITLALCLTAFLGLGQELIPFKGENSKWGLKDEKENVIIQTKYDDISFSYKSNCGIVKLAEKYGLIDIITGKEITDIKYDKINSFFDCYKVKAIFEKKECFLDTSGKHLTPLYDKIDSYYEGYAIVSLNDKYGFINFSNEEVIPLKYDLAKPFNKGLAPVLLNDKWGFIDTNDKLVIPCKYDKLYSSGFYAFYGEREGNICKDYNYEYPLPHFSNGLSAVRLNGKWGYIDSTGKEIIPFKYAEAYPFSEDRALVMSNNKYGFINVKGEIIIPFQYQNAHSFKNELAAIGMNDRYGFIDKIGNEIIPLIYESVENFGKDLENIAKVKLNSKYGYIDKTGKEIIPIKYDEISFYSWKGTFLVKLNDKEFEIDQNGNEIKE